MFLLTSSASICTIIIIIFFLLHIRQQSLHDGWPNSSNSQHRSFRRNGSRSHYHDADGKATESSVSEFSDGFQRFFITVGTLSGLLMSTYHALGQVFQVPDLDSTSDMSLAKWIIVAGWVRFLMKFCWHCLIQLIDCGFNAGSFDAKGFVYYFALQYWNMHHSFSLYPCATYGVDTL